MTRSEGEKKKVKKKKNREAGRAAALINVQGQVPQESPCLCVLNVVLKSERCNVAEFRASDTPRADSYLEKSTQVTGGPVKDCIQVVPCELKK